jgi:hypothetical protein
MRSFLLALVVLAATSIGTAAQQPAASPSPAPAASQPDQPLLKPAQLEALVAPIALYPDALLANMLAAATYPLEVVEADRFTRADLTDRRVINHWFEQQPGFRTESKTLQWIR